MRPDARFVFGTQFEGAAVERKFATRLILRRITFLFSIGVRLEVVIRRQAAGFRQQRQQALYLERPLHISGAKYEGVFDVTVDDVTNPWPRVKRKGVQCCACCSPRP